MSGHKQRLVIEPMKFPPYEYVTSNYFQQKIKFPEKIIAHSHCIHVSLYLQMKVEFCTEET